MNVRKWALLVLMFDSIGLAVIMGVLALALKLPARSLMLPYGVLFCSMLVFAGSVYWAQMARDRPKTCALRIAIGTFFFVLSFLAALALSAKWVALPSPPIAFDFSPDGALFASASASVIGYIVVRQRLEAKQKTG